MVVVCPGRAAAAESQRCGCIYVCFGLRLGTDSLARARTPCPANASDHEGPLPDPQGTPPTCSHPSPPHPLTSGPGASPTPLAQLLSAPQPYRPQCTPTPAQIPTAPRRNCPDPQCTPPHLQSRPAHPTPTCADPQCTPTPPARIPSARHVFCTEYQCTPPHANRSPGQSHLLLNRFPGNPIAPAQIPSAPHSGKSPVHPTSVSAEPQCTPRHTHRSPVPPPQPP